jgi:hypothetical protein
MAKMYQRQLLLTGNVASSLAGRWTGGIGLRVV